MTSFENLANGAIVCPHCQPELLPSDGRRHELHLGRRFGDANRPVFHYARGFRIDATARTAREIKHAIEICPGPAGWAICLAPPGRASCRRCGWHTCGLEILRGWLRVEIDAPVDLLPVLWKLPEPLPPHRIVINGVAWPERRSNNDGWCDHSDTYEEIAS